ncbi:hypothetical protein [Geodermatophilus sp. DSM 45219]|uniref:hypothetical protein n=1 Tax=Geodermatophilus sp. DSM 45219 TaxID=1881103 RepID=UPI0008836EFF|nr:hypothetical protein [Geodermatophilus sp. DSM 45219]SDO46561.1 hypothetical protein SAMN05428965_4060 [Geodermatophilus sp. DSM 45219]
MATEGRHQLRGDLSGRPDFGHRADARSCVHRHHVKVAQGAGQGPEAGPARHGDPGGADGGDDIVVHVGKPPDG